jgi:hypothetical protein
MSMSASGSTMIGFFAPPWHWARLPAAVARAYTERAAAVEPTSETARTSGWSQMASTVSRPPCTRLTTPRGSFRSSRIWITAAIARGVFSDGFSTTVLPVAKA